MFADALGEKNNQWRSKGGNYLCKEERLARVLWVKCFDALRRFKLRKLWPSRLCTPKIVSTVQSEPFIVR
jgi:hypothetical protein